MSDAVILANTVPAGFPTCPGDHLSIERASYLQRRALDGPWAEYASAAGEDEFPLAAEFGLEALAYGRNWMYSLANRRTKILKKLHHHLVAR